MTMEIIILIVVGVIACWWLFALGKRIGSKKGTTSEDSTGENRSAVREVPSGRSEGARAASEQALAFSLALRCSVQAGSLPKNEADVIVRLADYLSGTFRTRIRPLLSAETSGARHVKRPHSESRSDAHHAFPTANAWPRPINEGEPSVVPERACRASAEMATV
jgi:hypothetical protein